MARRQKALHFNLKYGENVVFHREHRSKKGRNRLNRADNEFYYKKKRHLEELKQGVDKYTLRLLRQRYKI